MHLRGFVFANYSPWIKKNSIVTDSQIQVFLAKIESVNGCKYNISDVQLINIQ